MGWLGVLTHDHDAFNPSCGDHGRRVLLRGRPDRRKWPLVSLTDQAEILAELYNLRTRAGAARAFFERARELAPAAALAICQEEITQLIDKLETKLKKEATELCTPSALSLN